MRRTGVMLLLTALAAVPSASALGEVIFELPDARVHVDGTTVHAPTLDALPVQATGDVEIKDVDVSVSRTRCAVSTELRVKSPEETTDSCEPGTVTTTAQPTHLVDADLALLFPQEAPPLDEGPAPLATSAAIVEALPGSPTMALAAAAAGASMLGLYAAWRVLKWTGLAAFLPLYSHISDDEILDDPNRAGIYRLIQTEPGISTKDIADRLDLAWGTVTHHLGKLEKRRFVVSKKYGKYRRYFANGAGGTDQKDALAVLRLDRTGDVASLIRTQPGMTQKAVSQALGVSSSTILWHVKRLEEVNLVRKVREGKLVRYYPAEGMQGVSLVPAVPMTAA